MIFHADRQRLARRALLLMRGAAIDAIIQDACFITLLRCHFDARAAGALLPICAFRIDALLHFDAAVIFDADSAHYAAFMQDAAATLIDAL